MVTSLLHVLLFASIITPIRSNSRPGHDQSKCKQANPKGDYEQWMILHEKCWSSCVKKEAKETACGNRKVISAPTDHKPQRCRLGSGTTRVYCDREPNHLFPEDGGGDNHQSASCATEHCTGHGSEYDKGEFCRTGEAAKDASNIYTSIKCPHGTEQVFIAACAERTQKYTQQRICKITANVLSFTRTNDQFDTNVEGYFTVETGKESKDYNLDGTVHSAHVIEDDLLDDAWFDHNRDYGYSNNDNDSVMMWMMLGAFLVAICVLGICVVCGTFGFIAGYFMFTKKTYERVDAI